VRAVNVLLAFGVSLLIGLAVLELGLRLIPAFAPPATLNRFDPVTGWSKAPDKHVTRRVAGEKIHFDINEHGLRDDPGVGPRKEPNTYRVLTLGDSFVLGYTVNRGDLFVDQLEGWWKSEDRRIDVVNTGTEGWSTDQEVAWFLEHGKQYQPDLVLLFPYENDVYWNGQGSYAGGAQPKPMFTPGGLPEERKLVQPRGKSWLATTATARFLGVTGTKLRQLLRGPGPMNPEFGVLLEETPPELQDALSRTEGAFEGLLEACRIVGARLLVVPIPSKSAIDPDERAYFASWEHGLAGRVPDSAWSPDRPVNLFLEMAREHGIEALDPRAYLIEANKREKLYFPRGVEWHFNAAGNQAFATWLHDELDRREVFPAEHRARQAGGIPPHVAPAGGVPTFLYVFAALWAFLGTAFCVTYPKEPRLRSVLGVGAMLAVVFTIILGGAQLLGLIPHTWTPWIMGGFVLVVLGFVSWKLGRRLATIAELFRSFTLRGHWYLMPLVVVLLTIGSLLVVAASSPLIAPFIYTLF
jgi:lysophospholipase L1-like esterase